MASWSPRTFSFEQILAAAHMNEIRDLLNRVAPAKVTAKGDLVVGSEAHEIGRLGVGTNNQVLVADSAESLGVKWGMVGGACRIVRDTTTFAVPTSTLTDMEYETEEFDTHNFADLSVNKSKITIPTGMGGIYLLQAGMDWVANSTGTRQMRLYHYNSADVMQHYLSIVVPTDDEKRQLVGLWQLSESDYVKVQVNQTSGADLNIMYGDICSLSVALLYKL